MMNRRRMLIGLLAAPFAPIAAAAAKVLPEPNKSYLAHGGIIEPQAYLVGEESCDFPVPKTCLNRTASKVGEVVITVTADTAEFERDLARIRSKLVDVIALKKQLA